MSLFNRIERVPYAKDSDKDLISLKEYILFNDERLEQKYIVFKFKNNISQLLFEIKVEVFQYDENDKLIERSILQYKIKEGVKGLEEFVPNLKFKANSKTKYISVALNYAHFDKIFFENGEIRDNPLTFQEYRENLPRKEAIKIKKKVKVDKKERSKEARKADKKSYQRKATIKNVKNRHFNKVVIAVSTLLAVGSLAYGSISMISYKNNATEFTYGDFDAKFYEKGKSVYITSYSGKSVNVVIPKSLAGYKVVGIASKAFENNSSIKTIKVEADYVEVKAYAIYNCSNLTNISFSGEGYVLSNGINNCDKLQNISFDQGIYTYNSVISCDSLYTFSFENSYCAHFGSIFGVTNEKVTVREVYDYSVSQSPYFYDVIKNIMVYKMK